MQLHTLQVDKTLAASIAAGHPWIYRNHIKNPSAAHHGEWIRIEAGQEKAFGIYDSEGQIALRIFSHKKVPDETWFNLKVKAALSLRTSLKDTNCYRLINGENDGLPGITVDLYERYAVVKLYASSLKQLLPPIIKALSNNLKLRGIVTKNEDRLQALWGKLPPPELSVTENKLKLIANLYEGQKTGLFLDHRDNRSFIEAFCQDKSVLNLFSYTGAFSLYAARGGAKTITSVDSASAANDDAKKNFTLNTFSLANHNFITDDCFTWLASCAKSGKTFDLIIVDPPSLAQAKKRKFAALRAYKRLNILALKCLQPGGILATASCTSQISPEDFKLMLKEAASASPYQLQILHEAGQAIDHPVAVHFPEGRYLKFIVTRALAKP